MTEQQPIYVFKTSNDVGLDKVPPMSIVGILCTGDLFRLENKTGITSSTVIKNVLNTNLKKYSITGTEI